LAGLRRLHCRYAYGLSTPGNKVAEKGNKLRKLQQSRRFRQLCCLSGNNLPFSATTASATLYCRFGRLQSPKTAKNVAVLGNNVAVTGIASATICCRVRQLFGNFVAWCGQSIRVQNCRYLLFFSLESGSTLIINSQHTLALEMRVFYNAQIPSELSDGKPYLRPGFR